MPSLGIKLEVGRSSTSSGAPSGGGGGAFSNSQSVEFDGSDDYAALGSTITLSGNKSISYWAKLDAFNSGFAGRDAYRYTILHNNSTSFLVRFGATPILYTVSSLSLIHI